MAPVPLEEEIQESFTSSLPCKHTVRQQMRALHKPGQSPHQKPTVPAHLDPRPLVFRTVTK